MQTKEYMTQSYEFKVAKHFISALINDDESGLTDDEAAQLGSGNRTCQTIITTKPKCIKCLMCLPTLAKISPVAKFANCSPTARLSQLTTYKEPDQ